MALLPGQLFCLRFFHAIGPGHGKLLVAGRCGTWVPMLRLLADCTSSPVSAGGYGDVYWPIVVSGCWAHARAKWWTTAEDWLARSAMDWIAPDRLWLVWRGLRKSAPRTSGAGT